MCNTSNEIVKDTGRSIALSDYSSVPEMPLWATNFAKDTGIDVYSLFQRMGDVDAGNIPLLVYVVAKDFLDILNARRNKEDWEPILTDMMSVMYGCISNFTKVRKGQDLRAIDEIHQEVISRWGVTNTNPSTWLGRNPYI